MQDIEKLEEVAFDSRLAGLCSSYDVIRRTAERIPEQIAFHFLSTGAAGEQAVDISYAQFFARLTRTANLFHDLGVRFGDVISYIMPALPETHYILWGAQAAAIANPINPMLDVDHIIGIMTAARSRILVIESAFATGDRMSQILDQVPTLKHVIEVTAGAKQATSGLCYEQIIDRYAPDRLDSGRQFSVDDICALFHTGGTTGTPKMARHTHYNEIANGIMTGLAINLSSGDTGLCGLPLFHVNGALLTGLACFLHGASVVIASPRGFRTADVISNFWRIIEKYRVTFFSAVPTAYATLLQVPLDGADISSLRLAICGAAPMPRDIITRFEAATGVVLIEGYGMTEGTCVSSSNPMYGERRAGSIGLRLPYQEIRTVIFTAAGDYVRECKINEIGTLVIRGPNIFSGYLQAEDNRGIWLEDWLNTGDMGRQDPQGYFWLTGRSKELIIRSGHNIDPAVIENALIKHEAVREVVAVGKPDRYAGELPVAYVVLDPATVCEPSELIDFAKGHIAERAAIPKEIYLIDALPLTAIGKIFKPVLRRDATRRAVREVMATFNLAPVISVDPDKTYGTVVTITFESNVTEKIIEDIRHLMGHYAFHVKIIIKQ